MAGARCLSCYTCFAPCWEWRTGDRQIIALLIRHPWVFAYGGRCFPLSCLTHGKKTLAFTPRPRFGPLL
eukprot:2705712-Lingulodinium_polyedra.AAC.1